MVRKVYSYPGIAAGDIQVKVGRALIRVPFANGYIDKKMSRPAVYSTGDPVMQAIIENSDLFGRRIFLLNAFGNESERREQDNEVTLSSGTEHPEVTSWEEAVSVLKSMGAKAVNLRTRESAKGFASTHGVVFPNYNYE